MPTMLMSPLPVTCAVTSAAAIRIGAAGGAIGVVELPTPVAAMKETSRPGAWNDVLVPATIAPLLERKSVSADRFTTSSRQAWLPVVRTRPPATCEVPPALVARLARGTTSPTAALNVVVPIVFATRVKAPSTMPLKVIAPEPAENVASAPRITASANTCPAAPVVAIEPPSIRVEPPTPVARLVSGVVAPTAPPKTVAPVVLTANTKPPSIVEAKRMSRPSSAVSVASAASMTASLYRWPAGPDVRTAPPPRTVRPAASVSSRTSGVVPPTAAAKVVSPDAFTTNRYAPLTVPANVAAPVPVETVVSAASRMPAFGLVRPNVAAAFVVRIVPARFVPEAAAVETPPTKWRSSVAPSPRVTLPVFANETGLVTATLEPVSTTS